MRVQSPPKTPTPPAELRAIADLEAKGWTRLEILQLLNISRATYFRRKAEIARLKPVESR